MYIQDINDIDFEDMDDLPLTDHVEWEYLFSEDVSLNDSDDIHWDFI